VSVPETIKASALHLAQASDADSPMFAPWGGVACLTWASAKIATAA
jgi:hypothetical protein